MTEKEARIRDAVREIRINGSDSPMEITDRQAEQLCSYYDMLVEKNKVMNLTRITDFDEFVKKHLVDSLELIRSFNMKNVDKVLDLGSGAGFPGLPLKIVYPHIDIVMVDSVGKKTDFINEVIRALDIHGAKAVHFRAEDMARDKNYREQFDLCTSRAVARLATLCEYCLPFVKVGGTFAAYKSGESDEEIEEASKAIHVLGGRIERRDDFNEYDMKRTILQIRKVKPVSPLYPRKAGTPSKKPII
ncbi:MAG: 16S rRNA (guanine(527)-N(7))-methyltransferase RsmG [Chordicoccus sp.]|jgi:16S rRNA (guanine527-N7)-methyltransferase